MNTHLIKKLEQQLQANSRPSILGSLSEERQNEIRAHTKKSTDACFNVDDQRGTAMELARTIISNVRGRPTVIYYGLPWNELDYVPCEGKCIFKHYSWFSPVIESPTALDIAFIADEAIVATADYAFRWAEDIERIAVSQTGISVYRLIMST